MLGNPRPHRPTRLVAPLFALALALGAGACGGADDTATRGSSSSTGGGQGGAGGGAASDSAKPVCDGEPAGGATPDPRGDTAGALSADARELVVFGGDTATAVCGDIPKHTHVGDTWVLDTACGGWTSLPADPMGQTAPAPRARHAMALDPKRDRALLFGGRTRAGTSGPYTLFNDVWAFDFATHAWSPIATTGTPPSPRSNMAVAVVGDQLVVHGGNGSTSGTTFEPLGDAWALDLATNAWTELTASGGPKPRLFHAMAADEASGRVYVFSGGDANAFTGPFLKDAWALDVGQKAWLKLDVPAPAEGRIKLGMSVLPGASGPGELLAFGGHDDGVLGNRNDVVALDLANPSAGFQPVIAGDELDQPPQGQCDFPADFTKPDLASPERRSAFAFAPRADGKAFVVFGGDSDCGLLSDAFWFDAVAKTWTPIHATLPGLTCLRTGSTTCSGLCG